MCSRRLEDESAFKDNARFFNVSKPQKNNERWKTMMLYCSKNFKTVSHPHYNDTHQFEWPYRELLTKDIFDYFITLR